MTKSIRSVNITVRLDIEGSDLDNDEIILEVINNMSYEFIYDNYYTRILNTEIVDTFVPSN